MQHPFTVLRDEYSQLLAAMVVKPEAAHAIDEVAQRILKSRARFDLVTAAIGVPVVFSGPSFEREADLNFNLSPAQGDPWRQVSRHVPKNRGPFKSWQDAAVDAYRLNGLDQVGGANWNWELVCFYFETFNGFGYRDFHHMHSPYLWAGTNIQTIGKYTADGKFAQEWDTQLGAVPVARRLAVLAPDLNIPMLNAITIPPPKPSGIMEPDRTADSSVEWLQQSLVKLGYEISIDGNYGRETRRAVWSFQTAYGLGVDGIAGHETVDALHTALAALEQNGGAA